MTAAAEIVAALLVGKSLCICAKNRKIYIQLFADLRLDFYHFFKAVFHQVSVLFVVAETCLNRIQAEHHQLTNISFVLLFVPRFVCIIHIRIAELMSSYRHTRRIISVDILSQNKCSVNNNTLPDKNRIAVNQAAQAMRRNRDFFSVMLN